MSERRRVVRSSSAAPRRRSITAGGLALSLSLVLSVLVFAPSPASASTKSYSKTMQFTAKDCQAVVHDLPNTARIENEPGSSGTDKGQLVYGGPSTNPPTISYTCIHQAFSGEMLSWAIQAASTSPCYLPMHPPTGRMRGGFRVCAPWPFTHIAGTNVDFYTAEMCGASGGGSHCASISDYVRTFSSGFVLLSIRQVSSSPVPWIVTMLQQSTFDILRGAGGNPADPNRFFDRNSPQDWTLPNNWLLPPPT